MQTFAALFGTRMQGMNIKWKHFTAEGFPILHLFLE